MSRIGYPRYVSWTFLTNHAHVLHSIAREPDIRLRDIADRVGITERAVHRIVCDLEEAGYLTRHHAGVRNTYELHPRADGGAEHQISTADILTLLLSDAGRQPAKGS
ncbi:MAG TPA: helix-turn-helix domain-containing protein [Candidatus Limnocylindria bacterium]|nr:helix-turn-helix domain-containing protein [Candidatus Limnocylindria bacterium]